MLPCVMFDFEFHVCCNISWHETYENSQYALAVKRKKENHLFENHPSTKSPQTCKPLYVILLSLFFNSALHVTCQSMLLVSPS